MISVFLALCLSVFLFTGFASAAGEREADGGKIKYTVLEDNTVEIVQYTGTGSKVTVPARLNGKRVSAIGDRAFSENDDLVSVIIPEGIRRIGDEAFLYCYEMTDITIPDSVTDVGANPFAGCISLEEIYLSPDHPALEVIDGVLFGKGDRRLISYPKACDDTVYTVPEGTEIIGANAFYTCGTLKSITLPDGLRQIGEYAFNGCGGLTGITIPDSVVSIGANPFIGCSRLAYIRISANHPAFIIRDGVLFSREEQRLICYPGFLRESDYTAPEGTRIIGKDAFHGNDYLQRVTIPDSVIRIEEPAFSRCRRLADIRIPDSLTGEAGGTPDGADEQTASTADGTEKPGTGQTEGTGRAGAVSAEWLNEAKKETEIRVAAWDNLESWYENGVGRHLPKFELLSGEEIQTDGETTNSEDMFRACITNATIADFEIYVRLMKKFGYTIENRSNTHMEATNEEGYEAFILYDSDAGKMKISCVVPVP